MRKKEQQPLKKLLTGHIAGLCILGLVFFDCFAVFGETIIDVVCEHYDPRVNYEAWENHNQEAAETLSITSKVILFLLLAYQICLLSVLGVIDYIKDFNNLLDSVIILVSIILDFCLPAREIEFIIVGLSWRCVRIIHSLFCEIEEFEKTFEKNQEETDRLHKLLEQHGISYVNEENAFDM